MSFLAEIWSFMLARKKFWLIPIVLAMVMLDFIITGVGYYRPLLPVFAKDILRVGPAGFGMMSSAPAIPPVWKVRMVSCVPGSPIDWAAMTPTASPSSTSFRDASDMP